MKKKSSWLTALVFIFFCIVGYTYKSWQESDVMSKGVRDTAVVNDINFGRRSRDFEYQYDVNGIIYHGHHNKSEMRTRNGEFVQWRKLKLGDSIVIMYKQSEPQKSFPLEILGRKKKGI
jgi:hypothetical protein